ncbi:MAG: hypothetical protein AzoDbin1_01867 [Azoarcus sp.]|nr:hypothetical protein [Azoarcus sp.]
MSLLQAMYTSMGLILGVASACTWICVRSAKEDRRMKAVGH